MEGFCGYNMQKLSPLGSDGQCYCVLVEEEGKAQHLETN